MLAAIVRGGLLGRPHDVSAIAINPSGMTLRRIVGNI